MHRAAEPAKCALHPSPKLGQHQVTNQQRNELLQAAAAAAAAAVVQPLVAHGHRNGSKVLPLAAVAAAVVAAVAAAVQLCQWLLSCGHLQQLLHGRRRLRQHQQQQRHRLSRRVVKAGLP
jgi:hypothetical protein